MADKKLSYKRRYELLLKAFSHIWWLARRYADGRSSTAASSYNNALHLAMQAGFPKPGNVSSREPIWAMDSHGGLYSNLSPEEIEEYNKFPGRAVKDASTPQDSQTQGGLNELQTRI